MPRDPAADLARLRAAVVAMRKAQQLELDALPRNLAVYKAARQKRDIARLEAAVDALLAEITVPESPR
jgi:hypothetical protein